MLLAASGVLVAAGVPAQAASGPGPAVLAAAQLCSGAYPDFCIPPPQPDLNCEDIEFSDFTALPPDPHNFDVDNDGRGCEDSGKPRFGGQPAPATTSPAGATTTAPPITRPAPTVPATTTTTTAPATTTTTAVEGMATTGIDTDRRVMGASLLVCAGASLVIVSASRRKLRLD